MMDQSTSQSMRLHGYDYRQAGGYFVTFNTQGWVHLFGQVKNSEMLMNDFGRIVQRIWLSLPEHYTGIELDEYVVMPNHFHGILIINGLISTISSSNQLVGAGFRRAFQEESTEIPEARSNQNFIAKAGQPAPTKGINTAQTDVINTVPTKGINSAPTKTHSLSEIVRAFKTFSSREINKTRDTPGVRVWHKDFYDRVIRNEEELDRIREYIRNNPARFGQENPFL